MRQCNTQYCENEVSLLSNLKCDNCIAEFRPKAMISCKSCGWESEDTHAVHDCKGLTFTEGGAIGKQVGGNHYKKHTIQPWHIIDDYELDFYLGNTIKYVLRTKGNRVEDLQKAIHYLERKVELLESEQEREHTGSLFDGLEDDEEDTVRG